MVKLEDLYEYIDYDIITDLDGKTIAKTNLFTKNMEKAVIINETHPFFLFLNEYTFNLFDFQNKIVHAWSYIIDDYITIVKFYVKSSVTQFEKSVIHNAWYNYNHSLSNYCQIYTDEYSSYLYECNDYDIINNYIFNKEMLKLLLEKEPINKEAFKKVSDYIYNFYDGYI